MTEPSAEYLEAVQHLGEPNWYEQQLVEEVVKVDLSSTNSAKWNAVTRRMDGLLDCDDDEDRQIGAAGVPDYPRLKGTVNRMGQKGVAKSDITVFVVGEVACLGPVERALRKVIADPGTRLCEACLVLRDGPREFARIVKILRQEDA
jgi:hypothetical protein